MTNYALLNKNSQFKSENFVWNQWRSVYYENFDIFKEKRVFLESFCTHFLETRGENQFYLKQEDQNGHFNFASNGIRFQQKWIQEVEMFFELKQQSWVFKLVWESYFEPPLIIVNSRRVTLSYIVVLRISKESHGNAKSTC